MSYLSIQDLWTSVHSIVDHKAHTSWLEAAQGLLPQREKALKDRLHHKKFLLEMRAGNCSAVLRLTAKWRRRRAIREDSETTTTEGSKASGLARVTKAHFMGKRLSQIPMTHKTAKLFHAVMSAKLNSCKFFVRFNFDYERVYLIHPQKVSKLL